MSDQTFTKIQSDTQRHPRAGGDPETLDSHFRGNDTQITALLSRSVLYQALSFFFRRPDLNQDLSPLKENKSGSVSPMSFPRRRESRMLDPRFRGGDTSYETACGRIWQKALDSLSNYDPSKLRGLLDTLLMRLKNTTSKEWANEYERLLGYTVNGIAPAYELEYGEQHTYREPQQLADITAFYNAFGLKLSSRSHERADHASVELEFMYFLLYKEVVALEDGEEEKAQICREASRRFLSEHLGYWFPAFALRVSKHSGGFLKGVADFAFEFVVQDCLALSIKPGPEDLPIRAIQEKIESSCVSCCTNTPSPLCGGR